MAVRYLVSIPSYSVDGIYIATVTMFAVIKIVLSIIRRYSIIYSFVAAVGTNTEKPSTARLLFRDWSVLHYNLFYGVVVSACPAHCLSESI